MKFRSLNDPNIFHDPLLYDTNISESLLESESEIDS